MRLDHCCTESKLRCAEGVDAHPHMDTPVRTKVRARFIGQALYVLAVILVRPTPRRAHEVVHPRCRDPRPSVIVSGVPRSLTRGIRLHMLPYLTAPGPHDRIHQDTRLANACR